MKDGHLEVAYNFKFDVYKYLGTYLLACRERVVRSTQEFDLHIFQHKFFEHASI